MAKKPTPKRKPSPCSTQEPGKYRARTVGRAPRKAHPFSTNGKALCFTEAAAGALSMMNAGARVEMKKVGNPRDVVMTNVPPKKAKK